MRDATINPQPIASLDIAFLLAQRKELSLPADYHSTWLEDGLAHWVARNPNDLRRQVQRILLHQTQSQTEALFAALLDLFITLGASGLALRQRLFNCAKPLLNQAQQQFLASRMSLGVRATDVHPSAPRSRFSRGAIGRFDFVTREQRNTQDGRKPLIQALELMAYGQLSAAQEVLERALLADPKDEEIAQELAHILDKTHDLPALQRLLAQLGAHAPQALKALTNQLTVQVS